MKRISAGMVCLFFFSYLCAQVDIVKKSDDVVVTLDRNKGIKTFEFKDGSKKSINLTGKTPYGTAIENVQKPIQKNPVPVTLQFSAKDSDEAMDDMVEHFFNDLYSSLRSTVGGSSYKGEQPLSVVVSFCRYGEYGFCYKKDGNIYVRFVEGNKILKTFSMNSVFLSEKKKSVIFLQKVIGEFKKL